MTASWLVDPAARCLCGVAGGIWRGALDTPSRTAVMVQEGGCHPSCTSSTSRLVFFFKKPDGANSQDASGGFQGWLWESEGAGGPSRLGPALSAFSPPLQTPVCFSLFSSPTPLAGCRQVQRKAECPVSHMELGERK